MNICLSDEFARPPYFHLLSLSHTVVSLWSWHGEQTLWPLQNCHLSSWNGTTWCGECQNVYFVHLNTQAIRCWWFRQADWGLSLSPSRWVKNGYTICYTSSSRMLKNRDEQSCVSLEVILSSLLVACWLPCRACCDLGPCDRRTHHCHCRYQTPNLNRINCVKHFKKQMHKKSEMQLFEYV